MRSGRRDARHACTRAMNWRKSFIGRLVQPRYSHSRSGNARRIRIECRIGNQFAKVHDTCPKVRLVESHPLTYATHRFAGELAAVRRALRESGIDDSRIPFQLFRAPPNGNELAFHRLEQYALTIDAAPCRRRALMGDMLDRRRRTEGFVKVIDVTNFRSSGIGPLDSLGVGDRWTQLRPDLIRRLEQSNRVVHGLRHLRLTVESHHSTGGRERRLWLGKEVLASAIMCVPPSREDP